MEEPKNRYHNGKIYTIRSHQSDLYYIGSTCMPLYKRLYKHNINKKEYENGKHNYVSSFEILKYEDHYIELLEEYKCENKTELERREGELIRENKEKCVNIKKYMSRTKEDKKEYNKEYLINNKEHIYKKNKEYREENKELLKTMNKEWRDNNKPIIKELSKKYYETNKDAILEKSKIRITCICGSTINKIEKAKHERTKKHIRFIENNN